MMKFSVCFLNDELVAKLEAECIAQSVGQLNRVSMGFGICVERSPGDSCASIAVLSVQMAELAWFKVEEFQIFVRDMHTKGTIEGCRRR